MHKGYLWWPEVLNGPQQWINSYLNEIAQQNSVTHHQSFFSREFAGLHVTAKELGLGENIIIKLNRGSCASGCQERYSIESDKQLELEILSILNGLDKLLCKCNIELTLYFFQPTEWQHSPLDE